MEKNRETQGARMNKPKKELFENGVYSYHYYDADDMDKWLEEKKDGLEKVIWYEGLDIPEERKRCLAEAISKWMEE